ncbi:MAG: hypothetical protein HWE10_04795 [Gammaproteobacteria bacterium]|nr:hypothetical protein [Gammaproteobacteria bacterium]
METLHLNSNLLIQFALLVSAILALSILGTYLILTIAIKNQFIVINKGTDKYQQEVKGQEQFEMFEAIAEIRYRTKYMFDSIQPVCEEVNAFEGEFLLGLRLMSADIQAKLKILEEKA